METHTFSGADGLKLNVLDYGGVGKQPLLFVHGGSAHAHWWDFVAPAFSGRFHTLALDQRGHGDSPWTPEWAYGTRHYLADLETMIARWGLGAPILVGHSMGGHNVMCYAGRNSQTLQGVVIVDSPSTYPAYAVDLLRGVAQRPARRYDSLEQACAKFRTLPGESVAAREVLHHVARHSFRHGEDGRWGHKMDRRTMIRDPLDGWQGLKEINCPALFVKPSHSVLEPEYARKIVDRMPNGRLTEVPESYHHVMLDNPPGLIAALNEFVAQFE
ncbi:MAG: alpha/beta fold hydrolase [Candidatus Binataceae bacterium]